MAQNIIRQVDAAGPLAGRARPGEALLSVNGKLIRDVLDYKFYTYDRDLLLELRTPEGKLRLVRVRKAETGTDMQDIICGLLERELADELASVRARSAGGAR